MVWSVFCKLGSKTMNDSGTAEARTSFGKPGNSAGQASWVADDFVLHLSEILSVSPAETSRALGTVLARYPAEHPRQSKTGLRRALRGQREESLACA